MDRNERSLTNIAKFLSDTAKIYEDAEKKIKKDLDGISQKKSARNLISKLFDKISSIGEKVKAILIILQLLKILRSPIGPIIILSGLKRYFDEKGIALNNKIEEIEIKKADIPELKEVLSYDPSTYKEEVLLLQRRLNELEENDEYKIKEDGLFGKETLEAVNRYKEKYGLWNFGEYEGKVGQTTWEHLFNNQKVPYVKRDSNGVPILNEILSYNPFEYSPYVLLLQRRLIEIGYGEGIEANGLFDSKTLDAVNKYKEDWGLWNFGEYEGKVGETTWYHLFNNQKMPHLNEIDKVDSNKNVNAGGTNNFIKLVADIISGNEGGYGSVSPSDGEGKYASLSVGRLQWHGVRAHDLLRKIVDKNSEQAKQILAGTNLYEELMEDRSVFKTRTLNETEAKAVSKLLTTPEGIEAQNETWLADVGSYIQVGKSLGITDERALIYFADLYNQGPEEAKKIVEVAKAKGPLTLDAIHDAALDSKILGEPKFTERRVATYKKALSYNSVEGNTGNNQTKQQTSPGNNSASTASTVEYVVKSGDTLSKIAKMYNTTVEQLAKFNNIQNVNLIVVGQVIRIPKSGTLIDSAQNSSAPVSNNSIQTGNVNVDKFLSTAANQFGYAESGVNKTKYGEWFGMNGQPWCIMFISWCADQAGILGSVVPKAAHAFYMKKGYMSKGNYRTRESGYIPKAGDTIIFSKNVDHVDSVSGEHKEYYHGGIVVAYDPQTKTVYTIEGNANDAVRYRAYNLNDARIDGYGVNGGTTYGQIPKNVSIGDMRTQ